MDPALDIFKVAHRYREGDLTLDDVQEWLVPRLGVFLADARSTASRLAGLFELGFADISAGEAVEDELRELVKEFLRENETIQLAGAELTTTSNSAVAIGTLFIGKPVQFEFKPSQLSPAGR